MVHRFPDRSASVSATSKPLWLEGMFLRPQHLQQYDRWIEKTVDRRVAGLLAHPFGLRGLRLDAEALKLGQVKPLSVELVFPDGTPYSAPDCDPLPRARQVLPAAEGKRIFLTAALRSADGPEVAQGDAGSRRFARATVITRDSVSADRPAVEIEVGALTVGIVFEGESLDDMVALPIAEVEAVGPQGQVTLSESFVPPVMHLAASPRLLDIADQIRTLLRSRAEMLALAVPARGGPARDGMLDLMTLGIINRYETLFAYLGASGLHAPEALYRECIALIGELSAYVSTGRRPPELPDFRQNELRETFGTLLSILRGMLTVLVEENALHIPLEPKEFGIWLGEISQRLSFADSRFVLIAQADTSPEAIRLQMPIQVKIGPVEQIRDLVNLQLPGIGIAPMPVAPREIPFMQNAVYFELDAGSALWPRLPSSAAFAVHVSGQYPGLRLELWAIRNGDGQ